LTEPLAPYKFIRHFAKAKSGLPIRSGLTRCAAWTYFFMNYAMKDWAIFVERFGVPMRIGKYAPGATDEDKQALLAAVAAFGTDMAGVIPESMSMEFPEPRSMPSNLTLFREYMVQLEGLMSKIVLGQTLTTQLNGGEGSRAAAQVHRSVERELMEGDAKRLEATLNRDLVRPVVDLNFGVPAGGRYPKLRLGLPDDEDMTAWSKTIADLVDRGFEVGERTIREKTKVPIPEPGEKVLHPPEKITVRTQDLVDDESEPGDSEGADTNQEDRPARRVAIGGWTSRRRSPAQMADSFAERLKDGHWREVMDPLVEPVLKEIQAASSYEDLKHRLRRVAAKMDASKFQDVVARAMFNARLAGRWSARKEK
jgi:phage gp29-like protein